MKVTLASLAGYLLGILIGLDFALNALLCGDPYETVSSRAWRLEMTRARWWLLRRVIDAAFFMEREHCRHAYEAERKRRLMPLDLRA